MTEQSLDSLVVNIWLTLSNLLTRYTEADMIDETMQSMSAVRALPFSRTGPVRRLHCVVPARACLLKLHCACVWCSV
jgi:hypothetical protein